MRPLLCFLTTMRALCKKIIRRFIRRLRKGQLRRIFLFFLTTRPEVWIPLSRQSLHTIKIPAFARDLDINRFSQEDILSLHAQLKGKFNHAHFFFLTDSGLALERDDIRQISLDEIDGLAAHKELKVFLCAFNSDEKLARYLTRLKRLKNYVYFPPNIGYPAARYFHRNDIARSVLLADSRIAVPKFELADFENIVQAIEVTKHLPGPYVEIGVFQGRSAHVALNYMDSSGIQKQSYLIDTFEGFTYDQAASSTDARWQNTHTDISVEAVEHFLAEFNGKKLLKLNIISDELPASIQDVSVCNIDVDMYEAVGAALTKAAPRMARGGIMIQEDQGHTPAGAGAWLATKEFLDSDISKEFTPLYFPSGQIFFVRTVD